MKVKEPFFAFVDGIPHHYHLGQEVAADDPVVKGREHLFEPAAEPAPKPAAKPRQTRAKKTSQ
jgi:hypothetical protein